MESYLRESKIPLRRVINEEKRKANYLKKVG
jgi:hypothetical protein